MDEAEIRSKYEAGLLAKVSCRPPSPFSILPAPGRSHRHISILGVPPGIPVLLTAIVC